MTAPRPVTAHSPAAVASSRRDHTIPDVLRGLWADPKSLPPKLFYDAAGAALFERICGLDEYYLTRAELEILRSCAQEVAELVGPGTSLIEYGSGAGLKVRVLLDALQETVAYVPIDISAEQLSSVAGALARGYPGLSVRPLLADYTDSLMLPPLPHSSRRLAFFPGSTIGNFTPAEAAAFLRRVRVVVGPGGAMLLGVDRRKDRSVLEAAYNDASGVTAEFNLNVLRRLNNEYGADFDPSRFQHRAVWNDGASRIEMHLESRTSQTVSIAGDRVSFRRGETIWTESSYKYDGAMLDAVVREGGFAISRIWTDSVERFWLALLTVAPASLS